MDVVEEKTRRVKYIRALERVAKAAISGLKRADFDEVAFKERVRKNMQVLDKIEPVYLDQPYTKALEAFVNGLLTHATKEQLLKSANALEKLKNQRTYKKDKHKNKFKEER
ncbi:hypothetical protein [Campylobacter sp. 19-13652]|uniref:hypothetical protein n=1 Tax=Campylobacter sp. 19-13652 TaxID=2840180 RepID=UPI001C795485|nr:hypothetical protein [Campylobacter sp. 19-13652]BCX79199.1 hypothetical protein LBC_06610 [Campylobacter sp. 19-13652]